jgi:hypothetical protein
VRARASKASRIPVATACVGIGVRFVRPHQQTGYLLDLFQIHGLVGRWRVRAASLAKSPAQQRARNRVGARPSTMRSGCAVRSDVDVNEARIDPAAGLPVDSQSHGNTRTEIVQQDIGPRDQLMNNLLAFRALQVDLNGFLPA